MDHPLQNTIQPYLPATWSQRNVNSLPAAECEVFQGSAEYNELSRRFGGSFRPSRIYRYENINQFGLFLVRQQHLQMINPGTTYVKAYKYCLLRSQDRGEITTALNTNLDDRRVSVSAFTNTLADLQASAGSVVFAVIIIAREDDYRSITNTERDTDYYIQYVIYF